VGNADLDSDSDNLADAREVYLYWTSPTNSDTDADGYSDYEEVLNLHTDPNNNDTGRPAAVIVAPVNGYRRVWIP